MAMILSRFMLPPSESESGSRSVLLAGPYHTACVGIGQLVWSPAAPGESCPESRLSLANRGAPPRKSGVGLEGGRASG